MEIVRRFTKDILGKRLYYLPLLLFCIVGYSFSLFNRTIGWDDLLREHYFDYTSLAGRWGMTAWIKLLGLENFDPFIDRFMALVLLVCASILFSLLLFSITKSNKVVPYTIASSIFLTYPLFNEIWEYCGANFFLTGGLALTTLAVYLLRNNGLGLKWILISSLLLVLPISSYEASMFYYLALLCMVILLDNFYESKYNNIKSFIRDACCYTLPVIIAFVIRIIISFVIRSIYGLASIGGGATDINWLTDTPTLVLMKIAGGNFLKYVLGALVYFPVTEFLIALILFAVVIIAVSIRKKRWSYFVYGLLFVFSLYSQALLQGTAIPYRTAQTLTLLMAFMGYMIVEWVICKKKKALTVVCYIFMFGLCWYQSIYMNRLLGLNNLRSENEAYIVRSIGERIVRDFEKKPVVFISPYSSGSWFEKRVTVDDNTWNGHLYKKIVDKIVPESFSKYMSDRYVETNVNCVTEQYAALQNVFAYYGFDIDVAGPIEKPHTPEYLHKDTRLLTEAQKIAEERKMRPYEIYDNGEYLIVALSNKTYFSFDEE